VGRAVLAFVLRQEAGTVDPEAGLRLGVEMVVPEAGRHLEMEWPVPETGLHLEVGMVALVSRSLSW